MNKITFKYRIYPSKKQITLLDQTLYECRWLYNHFLDKRKNAWENEKKSISRFDQINTLPTLKQERPILNIVNAHTLQEVATKLDLAFKRFFRRVKNGEKPGYPRFRGKFRYDSFTHRQGSFWIIEDKSLVKLSKIGNIKLKYHRPIQGNVKTCTVKRTSTNKWFVCFSCEVDSVIIPKPANKTIGIDVGLVSFATLSTSKKITNPRFFKQEEKALASAQRRLSAQKKGSTERDRARKVVARIHERISNKRTNFAHQLSRKLVNEYDFIAVEDLNIKQMKENNFKTINKSIGDAAWNMFSNFLSYKAEYAGKRVVKVNPAYTSQTCSGCGHRHKLKLSERVFVCPSCNMSFDRDHNSALNILTLGLQGLSSGQKAVC